MSIDPIDRLASEIMAEMERVWGESGLGGGGDEYDWLLETYGITEAEDVKWQFVLEYNYFDPDEVEELDPEDPDDKAIIDFLENDEAVIDFLQSLFAKYRSNSMTWAGDSDNRLL